MTGSSSFWTGATRALDHNAKLIWFYLTTGPHANRLGAFQISPFQIAGDIFAAHIEAPDASPKVREQALERVFKALGKLQDAGLIRWDGKAGWLWIVDHLTGHVPAQMRHKLHVARLAREVPEEVAWWPDFADRDRITGKLLRLDDGCVRKAEAKRKSELKPSNQMEKQCHSDGIEKPLSFRAPIESESLDSESDIDSPTLESDSSARVSSPESESCSNNCSTLPVERVSLDLLGHVLEPKPARGRKKQRPYSKEKTAELFEEWWQHWTLARTKRSKGDAAKQFDRALNEDLVDFGRLCTGVDRYMDLCREERTELRFIIHPNRWIKNKRYDDDYGTEQGQTIQTEVNGRTVEVEIAGGAGRGQGMGGDAPRVRGHYRSLLEAALYYPMEGYEPPEWQP